MLSSFSVLMSAMHLFRSINFRLRAHFVPFFFFIPFSLSLCPFSFFKSQRVLSLLPGKQKLGI